MRKIAFILAVACALGHVICVVALFVILSSQDAKLAISALLFFEVLVIFASWLLITALKTWSDR